MSRRGRMKRPSQRVEHANDARNHLLEANMAASADSAQYVDVRHHYFTMKELQSYRAALVNYARFPVFCECVGNGGWIVV